MNVSTIASVFGAMLSTFSVFKWIFISMIVLLVIYIVSINRNKKNALDSRAIKDLIKSANQWNARSLQDTNPLIAMMNANYAMAYFNVARSIGSDIDIEKETDESVDALISDLEKSQHSAMMRITGSCPNIREPFSYK